MLDSYIVRHKQTRAEFTARAGHFVAPSLVMRAHCWTVTAKLSAATQRSHQEVVWWMGDMTRRHLTGWIKLCLSPYLTNCNRAISLLWELSRIILSLFFQCQYNVWSCTPSPMLQKAPPTWYVETGEAAMKGVMDACAIIRLVEMLYGEE